MIEAKHSKVAHGMFNVYLQMLFKSHFHSYHLLGNTAVEFNQYPVLLIGNHSSWWDGFFVYYLNQTVFRKQLYLMMLENELSRNSFFSRVGAYSINQNSISAIKESLLYSAEKINTSKNNMVCIFPQGELLPWHTRPLGFDRGVELVLKKINTPINIYLLGIRVEDLGEQRPFVFFQFENKLYRNPEAIKAFELENELTNILDTMQNRIVKKDLGKQIFSGKQSVNRMMEVLLNREHRRQH